MARRDLVLLLALSAIWGSSFLFIKLGVDELEPAVVALGRLVIGALVLVPLLRGRGGLGPLRGYLTPMIVLGLVNNAVPYWLLGFAETRIDSGLAAIIQAAAPIFTVLLALRVDRTQSVRGLRLFGIAVAFLGVALLVGGQRGGELLGAVAVVGVALCYAFSVLYAGLTVRSLPPLQVSIGQFLTGAVVLVPFTLVQRPADVPSWDAVLAVGALGVLGTGVAYLIYFELIATAGAARAILVTYLVPAFAVVYGALFLDEPLELAAVLGLGLVLGGTALGTGLVRGRRPVTVGTT